MIQVLIMEMELMGAFTDFATSDHTDIARFLRTFEQGEIQFQELVNSDIPTTTSLDFKSTPEDEDGALILGLTKPSSAGKDGKIAYGEDEFLEVFPTRFDITIFWKNARTVAGEINDDDPDNNPSLNGTVVKTRVLVTQLIGIIFGHEIGHANAKNLLTLWNNGEDAVEVEPTKVADKMLEELKN